MMEIMTKHGHIEAWDEKEFDKIFDLFEEDEPDEDKAEKAE